MTNNETQQVLRRSGTSSNISQEQLAAKLNVSFATVNRWESGKSKPQKAQAQAIEALAEEAGLAVRTKVRRPPSLRTPP